MSFLTILAACLSGFSRTRRRRRPQPRPARRGIRLTLEHLEDRTLPSSYTAASVSDLITDINAANTAGGANTITLTAPTTSPYALTARNNGGNATTLANGLPVIAANDNLTIVGNGDTIERTGTVAYRLLDVAANASLTLQDLTLQGGLVEGVGGSAGGASGGAIYNAGALTLSGVTVANNQAYSNIDGPAAGGGIWSDGSLTLENGTLLEGNIARGTAAPYVGPAFGGAVYVAGGTANITSSTFTGNSAIGGVGTGPMVSGDAFGGAIYVTAGQVILTNTTVTNNFAYVWDNLPAATTGFEGGGLYIAGGTVTFANDTVQSNAVAYGSLNIPIVDLFWAYGGYGGGMYVAPVATVSLDAFTLANTTDNSDSSGTNGSTANIDFAPFPPTVVNAASASPSPVTGTTTNLSVLGNDPAGQAALTYTWAVTSAPAGGAAPTFSSNGSNAAQDTTATFYRAGTYTFQVTLTDPSGLTAVSSVTVTVVPTVASLSVTPGTVTLADGAKQQFTAIALDQFGQALAAQPKFTWQVSSGGGTISNTGLYTAPKKGTGKFQVTVSADGLTAQANVTLDA